MNDYGNMRPEFDRLTAERDRLMEISKNMITAFQALIGELQNFNDCEHCGNTTTHHAHDCTLLNAMKTVASADVAIGYITPKARKV